MKNLFNIFNCCSPESLETDINLNKNKVEEDKQKFKEYDKIFYKKLKNTVYKENKNYDKINLNLFNYYNSKLKCLTLINSNLKQKSIDNVKLDGDFKSLLTKIVKYNNIDIHKNLFLDIKKIDIDIRSGNKLITPKKSLKESILKIEKLFYNFKIKLIYTSQNNYPNNSIIIKKEFDRFLSIQSESKILYKKVVHNRKNLNNYKLDILSFMNFNKKLIKQSKLSKYLEFLNYIKTKIVPFFTLIKVNTANIRISEFYKILIKTIIYFSNEYHKRHPFILISQLMDILKNKYNIFINNLRKIFKKYLETRNQNLLNKNSENLYNIYFFELMKIQEISKQFENKKYSEFLLNDSNIIFNFLKNYKNDFDGINVWDISSMIRNLIGEYNSYVNKNDKNIGTFKDLKTLFN